MNYRQIKLANGKIVTIEDFRMQFVYDGMLLGQPNKEVNEKIISNFIKSFNSNKVFIIMDDAYVTEDQLKPIIFSAQLVSGPVNDKEEIFDGSYLNIVWFGDDFKSSTIDKMIINLKSFDWDVEAENYEF
nr:hypothetical protein [uncultured Flavobacterium sp.]